MKYWFDTEFIERGPDYPLMLLSIGIVAEDGRELYLESDWVDRSLGSPWVQENVIPYLMGNEERSIGDTDSEPTVVSREDMSRQIREFCDPEQHGKPEFWAYYADYDWVVLCQLFGTMMDLPKGWPMYCRDIKQEADRVEAWTRWFNAAPDYKLQLPEQGKGEHHALADAKWNRIAWAYTVSMVGPVS